MFSVLFEVHPKPDQWDAYLGYAKMLRPELEQIDGFVDNIRSRSLIREGWILSLSNWRDEKSVVRWRTRMGHHKIQEKGRNEVLLDYHLRVGQLTQDTRIPEGLFFLTAGLLPHMMERGSGKVINITTGAAFSGVAGIALYGSSKAAVTLLTKSWAAEFGPSGVNINAIVPGVTVTPGTANLGDFLDQIASDIPARRIGQPMDVVGTAIFLASSEADYIHGASIPVDGGFLAV